MNDSTEQKKDEHHSLEVSSGVEKFLRDKIALELFSMQGKVIVIFVWTVGTFLAIYGCMQVEVAF